MFFEFLHHLVSLDLAWLATLLCSNFHWLFTIGALMFFFFSGKTKSVFTGFIIFCMLAWAIQDMQNTSGWVVFVGGFLAVNYVAKLSVLSFAESDPKFSKYLLVINMFSFYIMWSAYNIFMV